MEWKKDLYSLIDKGIIKSEDFEHLAKLQDLRDEIFFPDFIQFNYIPQQTIINESKLIIIIDLGLISVSSNRLLSLNYGILKNSNSALEGGFGDLINILNEDKGWDNTIFMDLFVERNFGEKLKDNYLNLETYAGNFEEKVKSCLNEIKGNYFKYAKDIISGEKWDRNAWRDLRD